MVESMFKTHELPEEGVVAAIGIAGFRHQDFVEFQLGGPVRDGGRRHEARSFETRRGDADQARVDATASSVIIGETFDDPQATGKILEVLGD
jgi:hypothetical protein